MIKIRTSGEIEDEFNLSTTWFWPKLILTILSTTLLILSFLIQVSKTSFMYFWLMPLSLLGCVIAQIFLRSEHKLQWLRKIKLDWYIICSAAVSSLGVAVRSLETPAPENYWLLFVIWFLAILCASVCAFFSYYHVRAFKTIKLKNLLKLYWWEVLGITCLTVLAFFIRIYNIAELPFPFSGDEAAMAMESLKTISGGIPNMFSSGLQGHPVMYFYVLGIFHRLFEPILAQRLLSVLLGAITIPIFYIFLRQIWGKLIAFVSAAYLTTYHFHHHYSRVGMNNIGDPLIILLTLIFVWRVLHKPQQGDFIITGLLTGASLYFYAGARLLPVLVIGFLFIAAFRQRKQLKNYAINVLFLFLAYCVVALPLGMFWIQHPTEFTNRIGAVGIFQSGWLNQQKETGKSTPELILTKLDDSFGLFGLHPEHSIRFYNPPIPLVDVLSFIPFLIGLIYSLCRFWELRNLFLLALFFGSVGIGGLLTVEPHSGRFLATIPAISAWVAIGLVAARDFMCFPRKLANFLIFGALVFLMAYNSWFYFVQYSNGDYYSDWNTRAAQRLAEHMQSLPPDAKLFMHGAPHLYAGHPTSALILYTNNYSFFDVLEDGRMNKAEPLDSSPRVFAFTPAHRQEELERLQEVCPDGTIQNITNWEDKPMILLYQFLGNSFCVPSDYKTSEQQRSR